MLSARVAVVVVGFAVDEDVTDEFADCRVGFG